MVFDLSHALVLAGDHPAHHTLVWLLVVVVPIYPFRGAGGPTPARTVFSFCFVLLAL